MCAVSLCVGTVIVWVRTVGHKLAAGLTDISGAASLSSIRSRTVESATSCRSIKVSSPMSTAAFILV